MIVMLSASVTRSAESVRTLNCDTLEINYGPFLTINNNDWGALEITYRKFCDAEKTGRNVKSIK